MKDPNCTACQQAGKKGCGGHWSRRVRPRDTHDGTTSRLSLDVLDGAFDTDAYGRGDEASTWGGEQ